MNDGPSFFTNGVSVPIIDTAAEGNIDREASMAIARASLGSPRKALSLLASIQDLQLARDLHVIDLCLANQTLKRKCLLPNGLGPRHEQALEILRQQDHPIGQTRLALTMGLDPAVFRSTIQSDFLAKKLITMTPLGVTLRHQSRQFRNPPNTWQVGTTKVREHSLTYGVFGLVQAS
jgi:Holliday junction resolvasome RuvABC ATP-dependent DNA helicase subunit